MEIIHVLLIGIFSLIAKVGCRNDFNKYDNYTLISLYPRSDEQFNVVRRFEDPESAIFKRSHGFNDSLDILVPEDRVKRIKKFAKENDLILNIRQKRYGRTLLPVERSFRRAYQRNFNIFGYNSYATIQGYLENLARERSDLVTLQNLGNSYEGRNMKLVKISTNPSAGNPVIFIDAGIHAREWVAPAMALYLIHRLVNEPDSIHELNGLDWYILPVVNPDGYEYTRISPQNRLWRKTRSQTSLNCYGVDGNRNYGFKWGVSGVSQNPCDQETYAGSKPFSEVETQMVRNIMFQNANSLKLYVSLHAYGNYLVYPWGYTGEYVPKQWKKLHSLAKKVSDAIYKAGGQPLKVMSAGRWYAAAGGSDDYAFGSAGVPYSYTMELTEDYDFRFPEHLLRKVLPQFYQGFKVFALAVKNEFNGPR